MRRLMRSVRQAVATAADLIRFENRGIEELEISTSHQQLTRMGIDWHKRGTASFEEPNRL